MTTKLGAIKQIALFRSSTTHYLLGFIVVVALTLFLLNHHKRTQDYGRLSLDLVDIEQVILPDDAELARARAGSCSYWDCFDVYRCGQSSQEKISIYVYPFKDYMDQSLSQAFQLTKEFFTIVQTVVNSPYYTSNPNEACLFMPSIDTLNQNLIDENLVGKALATLPYWENGENHLLFNILSGTPATAYSTVMDVNTDRAMIVGTGFDTWTYRVGFDMTMPFYSPILEDYRRPSEVREKKFFLISSQLNIFSKHLRILRDLAFNHDDVLLLQRCDHAEPPAGAKQSAEQAGDAARPINPLNEDRCAFPSSKAYAYPEVLETGTFCLIIRGLRLSQPNFIEAMATGCIPVVVVDNFVMPFSEVIDWNLASISVRESDFHSIISILKAVSATKVEEMQRQVKFLYEKYFCSLERIVLTVLDELNDRVFPHLSKTYLQWNMPQGEKSTQNPLFLPIIAPKSQGFTAVILTYDRIESLFTLIHKLSVVNSLQKILVIWNNQKKSPPHPTMFPKISKPLKVIQTKANKLSNRFYPYEDIETEAILTIDDDIVMLTADELDFGYEVWREFPDRIVGFPSRTHVWDNVTHQWRYESEWTNQISMVLTGAAFHHKYWSYMYTNAMPGNIKEWVDEHMNCEDIAMNFLVANNTNKPPIKVTPRKKFKCPECTNNEMLSADLNHMIERSGCIDRFAKIYGTMPLKTIEFRADPVLFKDNFPEKLKKFNDIGSL